MPQQELQNVNRNISAFFDMLCEVLSYDFPVKGEPQFCSEHIDLRTIISIHSEIPRLLFSL